MLIESSQRIGLKINEDIKNFMTMIRRLTNKENFNIGQYTFEQVGNFKYLGVNIDTNNNMHNERNLRIATENRSYFVMNRMFKSRLLKESKIILYTTYLRLIIMYGCETWSITKSDEGKLLRFEEKILRKINGSIRYPNDGEYERRKNADLKAYSTDQTLNFLTIQSNRMD